MRTAFFGALKDIASRHKDVYLLTANVGFKLFDEFRENFPERFIDAGVAEANMIGISSGLALSGKNVYCYSMIPFLLMRACEQVRIDIAYHDLNIKLVGVGSGFNYGLEGYSHFGIEDISLMRSLQNMNVIVPADSEEAKSVAGLSYDFRHPLYIRLGRAQGQYYDFKKPPFEIGKGMVLSSGKKVAIFAVGEMVCQSALAILFLKKKGIRPTLINMHTIKPLDKEMIKEVSSRHETVFTVEEHNITGGLGSAVSEVLAENSYKGRFKRIGIPDRLNGFIGDAQFLRKKYGLDANGIADKILKEV